MAISEKDIESAVRGSIARNKKQDVVGAPSVPFELTRTRKATTQEETPREVPAPGKLAPTGEVNTIDVFKFDSNPGLRITVATVDVFSPTKKGKREVGITKHESFVLWTSGIAGERWTPQSDRSQDLGMGEGTLRSFIEQDEWRPLTLEERMAESELEAPDAELFPDGSVVYPDGRIENPGGTPSKVA